MSWAWFPWPVRLLQCLNSVSRIRGSNKKIWIVQLSTATVWKESEVEWRWPERIQEAGLAQINAVRWIQSMALLWISNLIRWIRKKCNLTWILLLLDYFWITSTTNIKNNGSNTTHMTVWELLALFKDFANLYNWYGQGVKRWLEKWTRQPPCCVFLKSCQG